MGRRTVFNELEKAEERDKYEYEDKDHFGILYFLLALAAINFIAVIYVTKSQNIYFWDNATYWDIARNMAKGIGETDFWKNIWTSIGSEDYNYVAGIVSAYIVKRFGESRLVYILGLINVYLVPCFAMVYFTAKRLGKAPWITLLIVFLTCPLLLFITLIGFVDIGGVFLGLVCYALWFGGDKKMYLRCVVIGALLVLMMIWRRWYAFFAVSFITAMAADSLIFKRKKLPLLCTCAVAAALLCFVFKDFLINILLRDYGNLYSGYKFSIGTDLKLLTRYMGALFIAVLALASIAAAVKKQEYGTLFMWIQMLVCFMMFALTQTHGQQHLLLYMPAVIMLVIILVKHITNIKVFAAVCAFAVICTANLYVPRVQPSSISEIKHYALIPDFSMLPQSRSDINEIIALKRKLDKAVPEDKTLGILASSFKFNEDVFKNAEPSVGMKSSRSDYIVSLPQVDSRDTDMTPFYNVNYILAAFPAQTHLPGGRQTTVTEALRSFEVYADFAEAYEEMPEYETVIDGVTFKLYHRTETVHDDAMREFEKRLHE